MKKEDLLLVLLAALLLLAAIITILRGGEHSKHGYGAFLQWDRFSAHTSG